MYGPDGTFSTTVAAAARELAGESAPVAELQEVAGAWLDEAAEVAAAVQIPVQYRMAESDPRWPSDDAALAEFAGLFEHAPRTETGRISAVGHNIDHHLRGPELHLCQLAFALACAPLPTG